MEQSDFSIVIEPTSFEINKSRNLIGIIYIRNIEFSFPDNGWYDFVIVLLSWWIEAVNELMINKNETKDFLFMEGSHRVNFHFMDNEYIEVSYLSYGKSIIRIDIIPVQSFAKELVNASEKALLRCNELNFQSEDKRNLEEQVRKLKLHFGI